VLCQPVVVVEQVLQVEQARVQHLVMVVQDCPAASLAHQHTMLVVAVVVDIRQGQPHQVLAV